MSIAADMDGNGDMDIISASMMIPLLGMRIMELQILLGLKLIIATSADGALYLSLQQIWIGAYWNDGDGNSSSDMDIYINGFF